MAQTRSTLLSMDPSHPWRGRNLRECRVDKIGHGKLVEEALPLDLRHSKTLPKWAARRLSSNEEEGFLRAVFKEEGTKTDIFVEELIEPKLRKLYERFIEKYRPRILLAGQSPDPGTLFLNRHCKAMTASNMRRHYARLIEKYLGRRATPHSNRDSFAAHHSEAGGSMEDLKRSLWHKDVRTTWRYCRRFNPSNGAVVRIGTLERWHNPRTRK